jgi:glycosyltransferase involved in cell wall biosynthesis
MNDFLNKKNRIPLVSIGMPVFNGAKLICQALDSLLAQKFADFELIVSDNGSTDGTGEICKRYEARDPRIAYFRQPRNMGALWNFNYVLKRARGEYFMWAAADDTWEPDFIAENLKSFDLDSAIIASISKVRFLNNAGFAKHLLHIPSDTYPLMSGVSGNMIKFLYAPRDNSRFYSLYKRGILSKCVDDDDFQAKDFAIVIKTLFYGKYYEIDKFLFSRIHKRQLKRGILGNLETGSRLIDKVLPLFRFTKEILAGKQVPVTVKLLCLPALLVYNISYALLVAIERIVFRCKTRSQDI